MLNQGKLTKLEIKGYKDSKYSEPVSGARGVFKLQLNPKDYSVETTAPPMEKKTEKLANGTEIDKIVIAGKKSLSIEFYLDSTGVISGCDSVIKAVADLKWLCVEYQGEIHDSFFLQVIWNALVFNCKCNSLNVNYLVFKPDGEPVRAKVTASFQEFVDVTIQTLKNNTSSPDLSHLRTIKAGDTLPMLCKEIYGDPKYYLQVAKANRIVNFRSIKPGSQVLFPRLKK